MYIINKSLIYVYIHIHTYTDGALAMSSVNGLVGTVFASRYRLQPVFKV